MILIDGKAVASFFKTQIANEVVKMKEMGMKVPHLAAILVGNDGASETYVSNKVKACELVGFNSSLFRFDDAVSEKILLEKINEINLNDDIDGYIVQLPLPKHISVDRVINSIIPSKDVDGFHPENTGRMVKNLPCYIAATPFGILKLLEYYKIETKGKHCVVVGRSNIVGSPISILMARDGYPGNCTVTLCHSKTHNLKEHTTKADILIVALGKPEFITADIVKEGAVVIDVGLTRIINASKKSGFELKGDVKYDEVSPKCSYITPVPGGVGPMTIVALLENTLKAARKEVYS
jgi:methylenetetrahydrofolate dehydrogenase (NADP+)/methenyltetrahydrofolate cyclohydrolase